MITLQYVNAELLVWVFRVPDSSSLWRGRGFDFLPGKDKPSDLAKTTRERAPAASATTQMLCHRPELDRGEWTFSG